MIDKKDIKKLHELGFSKDEVDVLDAVYENASAEEYLFGRAKDIKLYPALEVLGYLDPKKHPPQEIKDGKIYSPIWAVLRYLRAISLTHSFREDNYLQTKVKDFIKEVTLHNKELSQYNPYTYSIFAEILSNIENRIVDTEVLELIINWFDNEHVYFVVTSEVVDKLIPKFINASSSLEDIEKGELILKSLLNLTSHNNKLLSGAFGITYHVLGEEYPIKSLFGNRDFVSLFSERVTESFLLFLKHQIQVALEISSNSYYVKSVKGTLSLRMERKEDFLEFVVFETDGVGPEQMQFAFLDDKIGDERYVSRFSCKVTSKDDFIAEFKNAFNQIDCLIDDKEIVARELSTSIFGGLYVRNTYESFFEKDIESSHDASDILHIILSHLLVEKSNSSIDENREIVARLLRGMLEDNYLYFKKLYLYVAAVSINDYSGIFWDYVAKTDENTILEGLYFGEELKLFLGKLGHVDETKIDKLESLIELGPEKPYDTDYETKWKQRIYASMKQIPRFNAKYQDLFTKTGVEYTLSASVSSNAHFVEDEQEGISPLSDNEIILMNNEDLVKRMTEMAQNPRKDWFGLLNRVYALIDSNPEKFFSDLKPFLESPVQVVFKIIYAFPNYAKTNTNKDISSFINFVVEYLERFDWNEELKMIRRIQNTTPATVFTQIVDSFLELSRNRGIDITNDCNVKLRDILSQMVEHRQQFEYQTQDIESEDYATITLNSTIGRILESHIRLTLRMYEDKSMDENPKWSNDDKKFYEEMLNLGLIEMYSHLGLHLNNFYWLDKDWAGLALERATNIYEENIALWKSFMNGYLWNTRVYLYLFNEMRQNYQRLFDIQINDNGHSIRKLVHHLCTGYLNGYEALDTNLFEKIMKHSEMTEIAAKFFWAERNSIVFPHNDLEIEASEARKKVLDFWGLIFKEFDARDRTSLPDKDKRLLSTLSRLIVFLYRLDDESFNWIQQLVPFVNTNFNSVYFVESLSELLKGGNDNNAAAHYVCEIFKEYLRQCDVHQMPTMNKEHIFFILKFAKEHGQEVAVKQMVDEYFRKGHADFAEELSEVLGYK